MTKESFYKNLSASMAKTIAIPFVLSVLCVTSAMSQAILEGRVTDLNTGEPILFGAVALYEYNDLGQKVLVTGTETDLDGHYRLSNLDAGVYDIEASCVGYTSTRIDSVYLVGDKIHNFSIEISEGEIEEPILITAPFHSTLQRDNTISIYGRHASLAGNFDDPSRSLIRFPGFANGNDQANSIIYHGLPADMIKWSVDGAEIVNPNHLANAGTLSDQSSASSGGVLAISQEMMDKFNFYPAPYETTQTNALAGVADIRPLHPKNQQAFIKLGLLGLEGAYMDSKVATHYRYSTVGLLGNLGVSFDNEKIVFQDLFAKYKIIDSRKNMIAATAILGRSSNDKTAIEDISLAEKYKDLQNIKYQSDIGIIGLSHTGHYKNDNTLTQSLFYSANDSKRSENTLPSDSTFTEKDNHQKISYAGKLEKEVDYITSLTGLNVTHNILNENTSTFLHPYIGFSLDKNKIQGEVTAGALLFHQRNTTFNIQGSLSGSYSFEDSKRDTYKVGFTASRQSQQPHFQQVLLSNLMHSTATRLYFEGNMDYSLRYTVSGFYQHLSHLPRSADQSAIDGQNFLRTINTFDGEARSYGVDIKVDKTFRDYTYMSLSTTLFDIKKRLDPSTNYVPGVYDYGYIVNGAVSKYFLRKGLNVHLGLTYRGGEQSYIPTPVPNSTWVNYIEQERLSPYLRVDLRLKYAFRKSELVLDIQNLTNRQNDAYYFYDQLTEQVQLQRQLGIIPILSWKYKLID